VRVPRKCRSSCSILRMPLSMAGSSRSKSPQPPIIGTTVGTSVQGTPSCAGACAAAFGDFPPTPLVTLFDPVGADAAFTTTATAAGAVGFATSTWTYRFSNPGWIGTNPLQITPPQFRCDNDTPNEAVGCVQPTYEPVWDVSLTGPNPAFARHLADAEASGLPGFYPDRAPLTRLRNPAQVTANGNTACPQIAALPRPTNHQCDEYPFRSTREGAFTGGGPGRTSPGARSPRAISVPAPGRSAGASA
jgi:hypothetical protein